MPVTWGRPLRPYPDDSGLDSPRARLLVMPVMSPLARTAPAARPKRRKSPGDPACDRCLWAKRGACPDHLGYYAEINPLSGIG